MISHTKWIVRHSAQVGGCEATWSEAVRAIRPFVSFRSLSPPRHFITFTNGLLSVIAIPALGISNFISLSYSSLFSFNFNRNEFRNQHKFNLSAKLSCNPSVNIDIIDSEPFIGLIWLTMWRSVYRAVPRALLSHHNGCNCHHVIKQWCLHSWQGQPAGIVLRMRIF